MQIEITTRQFLEYSIGGRFMAEPHVIEINERNPDFAKKNLPKNAFCFKFYSVTEAIIDGDKLLGKPKDKSPIYYPDATVWTLQQLTEAKKDEALILNCETFGGKVVNCNSGNWQPFYENDQII
jgi:hypothetical protein